jgi:hypothetical protein
VPATLLIIVGSIAGETAGTEALWIKLLTAATAATALQAGYLVGIGPWINQLADLTSITTASGRGE